MKSRARLALESLEGRWCPAVTAALNAGVLTISGVADNGSISVAQDVTTAGTITVSDGDTAVTGSPFTGVTGIRLNLTSTDDKVTIDLGGQTFSGKVSANLGGGADTLTVQNGTISDTLAVSSTTAPTRGRERGHGCQRGRGGAGE